MNQKNKIRGCVVIGILLVLISVIAFAVPFCKTATFWTGYIFALIAIFAQIYFFMISFKDGAEVKSRFYGFPIAKIGIIYLCVQLALSIVEMAVAAFVMTWIAVIIDVVILGLATLGCIAAEVMKEEIEKQDTVLKANVENMRSLQSLSKAIVGLSSDAALTQELKKLADDFSYSDPVSSEKTINLEMELNSQLKEIQTAVVDGDVEGAKKLCKVVMVDLAERNRVCKLCK